MFEVSQKNSCGFLPFFRPHLRDKRRAGERGQHRPPRVQHVILGVAAQYETVQVQGSVQVRHEPSPVGSVGQSQGVEPRWRSSSAESQPL